MPADGVTHINNEYLSLKTLRTAVYEIGDWIKIFVSSIMERHTFQTEDMSYSRLNMSVVQDLKDDFGTIRAL